ncbi:MAG TPA: helix-turn-helix transcriptional regulator [Pyrinomonadaceae bacterium]|jgi:AraC-like DNA-binding protein
MTKKYQPKSNILAIDCCEHILSALRRAIDSNLTVFSSRSNLKGDFPIGDTGLIVFGVSNVPARRLFISRLRRFYPEVPMLVLRRESPDSEAAKEQVRGEFVLSDLRCQNDLALVEAIRKVLPLRLCRHTKPESNYDFMRDVTRIMAENYADPELSLDQVAREIPVSPSKLSRILNKQVGISFRQLLKHIRIEEAKRILASKRYSIKEVAARVGFSDSHYFSRSFKEMTGLNATEFRHNPNDLIFN